MDTNEQFKQLQEKVEELTAKLALMTERQNSQYTDIMLILKELKTEKEVIDALIMQVEADFEEIYENAQRIVIESGKASTSFLQRKLEVGYGVACKIMDRLEDEMIVGPSLGSKPREVLIKKEGDSRVREYSADRDTDNNDVDDLYPEAKALALEHGKISASFLQRKLGIGYSRSARMIDLLEEAGIIETRNPTSTLRKVFVKKDSVEPSESS